MLSLRCYLHVQTSQPGLSGPTNDNNEYSAIPLCAEVLLQLCICFISIIIAINIIFKSVLDKTEFTFQLS